MLRRNLLQAALLTPTTTLFTGAKEEAASAAPSVGKKLFRVLFVLPSETRGGLRLQSTQYRYVYAESFEAAQVQVEELFSKYATKPLGPPGYRFSRIEEDEATPLEEWLEALPEVSTDTTPVVMEVVAPLLRRFLDDMIRSRGGQGVEFVMSAQDYADFRSCGGYRIMDFEPSDMFEKTRRVAYYQGFPIRVPRNFQEGPQLLDVQGRVIVQLKVRR